MGLWTLLCIWFGISLCSCVVGTASCAVGRFACVVGARRLTRTSRLDEDELPSCKASVLRTQLVREFTDRNEKVPTPSHSSRELPLLHHRPTPHRSPPVETNRSRTCRLPVAGVSSKPMPAKFQIRTQYDLPPGALLLRCTRGLRSSKFNSLGPAEGFFFQGVANLFVFQGVAKLCFGLICSKLLGKFHFQGFGKSPRVLFP